MSFEGSGVASSPGLLSSRPFHQTPLTGLPNPGHSDRDTIEVNENLGRKIFFFSPVTARRKEAVRYGCSQSPGMPRGMPE